MNILVKHKVETIYNNSLATLVAKRVGDSVIIAAAGCNLNQDSYCKKAGVSIALDKIDNGVELDIPIEAEAFDLFLLRALKYFKDVPYSNFIW